MSKRKKYIVVSIIVIFVVIYCLFYFVKKYNNTNSSILTSKEFTNLEIKKEEIKNIKDNTKILIKNTQENKDKIIKNIIDKKYDEAKSDIKLLLETNPEDSELWYINSSLQEVLSDNTGAISSVDNAILYDSKNIIYWKWKISLVIEKMVKNGVSRKSIEYVNTVKYLYDDALKSTNSNIEIITPYAIFLESVGDINQAIIYWEKAIVVNPLSKSSYLNEINRLKKI